MNELQRKKRVIILTVLFAGYLLFNGMLLAGHELWRDEANVWLMARELSPVRLFREMKYQGHPFLWYFFVMPFAKAGFPFQTISVISYLVMAVTAGIFLYKAPMHGITKGVCLFSPMFTYYYSVVARNYCLAALILVLLAYLYPKRNEKCILYGLLLGALVQTDSIELLTAGMISLMWLSESLYQCCQQKNSKPFIHILKGLWIPLASLILWIVQFYHVSDSPEYGLRILSLKEFGQEVINYSFTILSKLTGQGEMVDKLLFLLFFAGATAISVKLKNFWAMAVITGAFLFEAAFSVVVYQLHIWHFIAICFTFIWFLWVCYEQKKEKQIGDDRICKGIFYLLDGFLILIAVFMLGRWNSEEEKSNLNNALYGVYSDGANAAEYIRNNIPADALIVSTNIPRASTVLAYLRGYEFYYAGNLQVETYADWSEEQSSSISYTDLISWVQETFPDKEWFYIIDSKESCLDDAGDLKQSKVCYETTVKPARDETYVIYQVAIPD